jgi:hypothetical protein
MSTRSRFTQGRVTSTQSRFQRPASFPNLLVSESLTGWFRSCTLSHFIEGRVCSTERREIKFFTMSTFGGFMPEFPHIRGRRSTLEP